MLRASRACSPYKFTRNVARYCSIDRARVHLSLQPPCFGPHFGPPTYLRQETRDCQTQSKPVLMPLVSLGDTDHHEAQCHSSHFSHWQYCHMALVLVMIEVHFWQPFLARPRRSYQKRCGHTSSACETSAADVKNMIEFIGQRQQTSPALLKPLQW